VADIVDVVQHLPPPLSLPQPEPSPILLPLNLPTPQLNDQLPSATNQNLSPAASASSASQRITPTPESAPLSPTGNPAPQHDPADALPPPSPPPPRAPPPPPPPRFTLLAITQPNSSPAPSSTPLPAPRPAFLYLEHGIQVLGLPARPARPGLPAQPVPHVSPGPLGPLGPQDPAQPGPATTGPFVCPICLDPLAQAPADLLLAYAALARRLARPGAAAATPGGPRGADFRDMLGHCEREGKGSDAGLPTPCGHVFHARCLTLALAHAADQAGPARACPLCRASLDVRVAEGDPPPSLHGATGAHPAADPDDSDPAGRTGFFFARGRYLSPAALRRGRGRRPRPRNEWRWMGAAAAAAAAVGLVLVVLKFGFPGRVSWL
jgi:hypothetical protein